MIRWPLYYKKRTLPDLAIMIRPTLIKITIVKSIEKTTLVLGKALNRHPDAIDPSAWLQGY